MGGDAAGSIVAWSGEVVPRIACASGVVGFMTANTMIPQVVKTSAGRMPQLSTGMWGKMCLAITPKAAGLKAAQYFAMRELKLSLDRVIPSAPATMLSFGVAGTFFQSVIYNSLITDMYRIYEGVEKPRASFKALLDGLRPGFFLCFGRECFSMGGGIVLGPVVKRHLQGALGARGVELSSDYPLRFAAGFLSGGCTALSTQWLHNATLMAGRMKALGDPHGAPYYTMTSLRAAHKELGLRLFFLNFPQRMGLVATGVGVMNMVDIFHRPDLIAMRALPF